MYHSDESVEQLAPNDICRCVNDDCPLSQSCLRNLLYQQDKLETETTTKQVTIMNAEPDLHICDCSNNSQHVIPKCRHYIKYVLNSTN